ncbi:glycosyltransferase [Planktomarina temperata]|nr:glycosyltransferase [Planktomarina temperata]
MNRRNQNGINNASSLIIISEFCDGNANSTGFYIEEITKDLAEHAKITVVSAYINTNLRNHDNVQCHRLKDQARNLQKFIPKKVYRFFQILFVLKNLDIKNSSILIGTNPFLLPLLAPILKFLGSKYIVLLCYDFFPVNVLNQTKKSYLYPIFKAFYYVFRYCYRSCDKVIACGRDIQNLIVRLKFSNCMSTYYVPNWASQGNDLTVARKTFSMVEPRFLFFGNMGRFQAIPQILNQIAHVSNRKAKFIFAGTGEYASTVRKAAENDSRIEYLGPIPLAQKDEVFSYADISIISLVPNLKGCCVPSKLYFSLAANHPVICFVDVGSEVDLLCKEFQCGWNLDFADDFALDTYIKNFTKKEFLDTYESVRSFPKEVLFGESSLSQLRAILLPPGT